VPKEVFDTKNSLVGIEKRILFDEEVCRDISFEVQLNCRVAKEFQLKKIFQNPIILLESLNDHQVDDKIALKARKDEPIDLFRLGPTPPDEPMKKGR
jgi:hypothetical protein